MSGPIDPESIVRADAACRVSLCTVIRHVSKLCKVCPKYSVNWSAEKEVLFVAWEVENVV